MEELGQSRVAVDQKSDQKTRIWRRIMEKDHGEIQERGPY